MTEKWDKMAVFSHKCTLFAHPCGEVPDSLIMGLTNTRKCHETSIALEPKNGPNKGAYGPRRN